MTVAELHLELEKLVEAGRVTPDTPVWIAVHLRDGETIDPYPLDAVGYGAMEDEPGLAVLLDTTE